MIPTHLYEDYVCFVLFCAYPPNDAAFVVRRLLYDTFPMLRLLAIAACEYFPNGLAAPVDHVADQKFKLALSILSDDYTELDFRSMKNILAEFCDGSENCIICTANTQ